ncbi:MAG: McrC family protein [Lactobacillus sp.]|nr:McrC family protein [Lactobacillus sp.]
MKIVELQEGNSYTLNNNELIDFKEYLLKNPSLPVHIIKNNLIFDNYIIGSITVKNTSIIISPRIKNFTSNDYFEMQLYSEGIISDKVSTLLNENTEYGIQENLVSIFLNCLKKLVNLGLDGYFINKVSYSNTVHGRILVNRIDPVHLIQNEIPIQYDIHTFQTTDNKLIKLALNKCRVLIRGTAQHQEFAQVDSYFQDIVVSHQEINQLIQLKKDSYYNNLHMNPHYSYAIKLAIKILSDIKLNMKNHKLLGSSFLVNSNDLFEKYARAVLKNNLNSSISKWNIPHHVAKFTIDNSDYYKSYVPDVLIDYNKNKNSTYALLDAKNKDISDHQNIANLPDLYQVVFYCQSLKTKLGGLIYPTKANIPPTKIVLDRFSDINFYAFYINFSLPLKQRNLEFVNNVSTKFSLN